MLLELFEPPGAGLPASPVVIEEPEAFLHPGPIQVIRDSFVEASRIRQVLVTTHSPELLDDPAVPAEWTLWPQPLSPSFELNCTLPGNCYGNMDSFSILNSHRK